jgi:hypothetical protein
MKMYGGMKVCNPGKKDIVPKADSLLILLRITKIYNYTKDTIPIP